jgi:DNA-binding NtrC family response regulator
LKSRIGSGKFREDLYYRLNVVAIALPRLRERPDDIPLLAQHFVAKYAQRANRPVKGISSAALEILLAQPWPGNVRELENAIEHAVVFCSGDTIEPENLPMSLDARTPPSSPGASHAVVVHAELSFRDAKARALARFEEAYFREVLARADGNVSEAARKAGLDRSNFRRAARRAGVFTRDDD